MDATFYEHFDSLPEPYRSMAIRNTEDSFGRSIETMTSKTSRAGAMYGAFDWEESPEGCDFWVAVKDHMIYPSEHELPKIEDIKAFCVHCGKEAPALREGYTDTMCNRCQAQEAGIDLNQE